MSEIREKLDDLRIDRPEVAERRWVWIPPVALLVLLLAAGGWWLSRPGAAEVRTALAREVEVGGQQTVLNASGYVTARRQATVSSKFTGKVIEVLIEEGMEVEEGQVLARLDASNISTELRLAEAQLAAARSNVEETRVRVAEAELDLERIENLATGGVASQAELDAAHAEVDSLRARLESQRRAVEVAEWR
jgi:multidrug efflux pump subunit AcrA (membrane-fusion protein)